MTSLGRYKIGGLGWTWRVLLALGLLTPLLLDVLLARPWAGTVTGVAYVVFVAMALIALTASTLSFLIVGPPKTPFLAGLENEAAQRMVDDWEKDVERARAAGRVSGMGMAKDGDESVGVIVQRRRGERYEVVGDTRDLDRARARGDVQ